MSSKNEVAVAKVRSTYTCSACGKNFPAYAKLINHERIHTGEKPFVCHICSRAFRQSVHLKRHQKVHTNQRPHKCHSCDKAFKLKAHLKRHNISHHGYEVDEDLDCHSEPESLESDYSTNGTNGLNGHAGSLYECQLCGKTFEQEHNLLLHESKHAENIVFKCDVCGKGFPELQEMALHRRIHDEETSHHCSICNKDFATKSSLKCHIKTHSNDQCHVCNVCGAGFKHVRTLSMHKKMHEDDHEYKCEFCDKTFLRAHDLSVHIRKHTGERPYECDICYKAFKQKAHVVKHMETVHGESKRKLEVVSESSEEKNQYTKLRSKSEENLNKIDAGTSCLDGKLVDQNGNHSDGHNGLTSVNTRQCKLEETPANTCETCGKSFTQKSYLNVHRRIHTGEMPYECDICGQAFRQRSHAKKHIISMHKVRNTSKPGQGLEEKEDSVKMSDSERETVDKDEEYLLTKQENGYDTFRTKSPRKPFQCDICHKKFRQKGYLHVHKRIHTGERPYKCNICHRAFRQSTHVVKHKRTVHKISKSGKSLERQGTLSQLEKLKEKTAKKTQKEYTEKRSTDETFTKAHSIIDKKEFERNTTDLTSVSAEVVSLKSDKSSSTSKSLGASAEKLHACEVCGKAFKRKHYLAVHMRMHTGERPYKCTKCSRHFRQDCHLKVHMSKVHPDDYQDFQLRISCNKQTKYKCKYCSRVFKRVHLLKLHEKTHDVQKIREPAAESALHQPSNGSLERPFSCQYCPKAFRLKQHMISHERVHTGVRPFECSVCGRAFKQSSHLARHRKVHTEGNDDEKRVIKSNVELHKCSTCKKTFKTKKALFYHTSNCNSKTKIFTKGQTFRKDDVKKKVYKPHKCKECGKRFEKKQILVVHERSHTGEKPYKCDECGKAFGIAGNLQRHKVIHTGQRPFVCEICGKGFTQKSNMEAHIRLVHTGKREAMELNNHIRKGKKNNSQVSQKYSTTTTAKCEKKDNGGDVMIKGIDEKVTLNGTEDHVKEETSDSSEAGFLCCECGKGFNLVSSMMKHCVEEH